jgi:protein SCO1
LHNDIPQPERLVDKDPGRDVSLRVGSYTPPLLMLAAWLGVLFWWTAGFSAFTTFSYTLGAAGELPRAAPSFRIRDHLGIVHNTRDFAGRYVLLQFSYLNCSDVCPLTMATFQQTREALEGKIPSDSLLLLTVSVDPEHDGTERLHSMWKLHGRHNDWIMAVLAVPLDDAIRANLRRLGVWVSRRGDSDFNHSASAFLIDPDGRVVQVFNGVGSSREIVAAIEDRLR